MSMPIELVVDVQFQVMPHPQSIEFWDLPGAARTALAERGLPAFPGFTPNFQEGLEPELIPNLAGQYERGLLFPGQRLYSLASRGREVVSPISVGVVAGTGAVMQVRPRPVTPDDIPPSLRAAAGDFYHPAVRPVSSSLVTFAELAWRMRAARAVMVELHKTEPSFDSSDEETDAYDALVEECRSLIIAHIERIDDSAETDDPNSFWIGVMLG